MPAPRRSVLAMAVLSMLTEEPMHAYRMQQLIKERHKDDVVNVTQRNSVYQTIQRLVRDELVEVEATERTENRPERTTYRITDTGRTALHDWLYTMVSTPGREYPEFPAALSFLPSLALPEAIVALTTRLTRLAERLTALADEMAYGSTFLPRVFLIESEYQHQVVAAELAYVQALLGDLRAERVTWP
jgi:DNA-binding PadR family transcriptional regulator